MICVTCTLHFCPPARCSSQGTLLLILRLDTATMRRSILLSTVRAKGLLDSGLVGRCACSALFSSARSQKRRTGRSGTPTFLHNNSKFVRHLSSTTTKPLIMDAILLKEVGGPEVLKLESKVDIPEPKEGQVRFVARLFLFPHLFIFFMCFFSLPLCISPYMYMYIFVTVVTVFIAPTHSIIVHSHVTGPCSSWSCGCQLH